ncbi:MULTISPECIES: TetR/AcrR family transcriptional regulator [Psychrilyobacter]|uniref:TetR family transcriptional regulator n=1 Tax=Psychrilyobacter piezotolerans TaxID=2293438 RepID=A0ABX9KK61_9FUSO|nr:MULTISPECIES: TetR/AcrR family transcriptional regulator [Psychrilyobacter]MCS5420856.1 TetR/AcrR family transcriptional regulator [Psychrilyobacter sp. S5]NDI76824.1 TetR/AcrR family transcriptional regulator [Psychrilyobacter piezotolerans]RDE65105.1 TetR/AcrR family transcriptional regulator [Psychrilyobacter sp. S5]REI42675.1 TetR family transcriptional regulator [Psychrilyobacter piezotolerans]
MENQIMISGKKLFYKNGYFKTKISDITDDIGISTGNFYTYYSSKEVLLDKILREQLNTLNREFKIVINIDGNLPEILNNFFITNINFVKNMMPLYILKEEVEGSTNRFKDTTIKIIREYDEILSHYIKIILLKESINLKQLDIIVSLINIQTKTYMAYLIKGKKIEYLNAKSTKKKAEILTSLALSTCTIFNLHFENTTKYDSLTGVYSEEYFINFLKEITLTNEMNDIAFFVVYPPRLKMNKKDFFSDSILKGIADILKKDTKSDDVIGLLNEIYFIIYMKKIGGKGVEKSIEKRMKKMFKGMEEKYSNGEPCTIQIEFISIKESMPYAAIKSKIDEIVYQK